MNTKVWVKRNGGKVRVKDMDDQHLLNTIRLIYRWARAKCEQTKELYMILPEPNGDMAQMAYDDEFSRAMEAEPEDYVPEIYNDMVEEAERRNLKLLET